MKSLMGQLAQFLDLRKSVLVITICLGLLAMNVRWQESLLVTLEAEQEALSESLALLDSGSKFQGREDELDAFLAIKSKQSDSENWSEQIPPMVADQKLILRQVRPLGISQKGRKREEKLFVQVDGDISGFLAFLHHVAQLEAPIYVSEYLITSRSVGSGFVSVEMVLSRILL